MARRPPWRRPKAKGSTASKSAAGTVRHAAHTTANYDFRPGAFDGEGLLRVTARPLRRDPALIEGTFLLDASGDLVRVEAAW